jgi:PTS system ascorbate-specific IIC component
MVACHGTTGLILISWLIDTWSLALGIRMAIFQDIAQPYMLKVVGNDWVALAYTGVVGYGQSG